MHRIAWLAVMALTGAGLLFWRIGGAIGAEIGFHDARFDDLTMTSFVLGLFGLAGLIPGAMAWAALRVFQQPGQESFRRVAKAASVALFFLLPAVLHQAGIRPSPAPAFTWAIAAFLTYRFLLHPAAMKAASA